jgi:hypothetical protein
MVAFSVLEKELAGKENILYEKDVLKHQQNHDSSNHATAQVQQRQRRHMDASCKCNCFGKELNRSAKNQSGRSLKLGHSTDNLWTWFAQDKVLALAPSFTCILEENTVLGCINDREYTRGHLHAGSVDEDSLIYSKE